MKKKPRASRTRTAVRSAQRSQQKLGALRERLAQLSPGGRQEEPIEVSSASVIEPRAESYPCLRCEGALRCTAHESFHSADGETLRSVQAACRACGAERTLYFRIAPPTLN